MKKNNEGHHDGNTSECQVDKFLGIIKWHYDFNIKDVFQEEFTHPTFLYNITKLIIYVTIMQLEE